MRSRGRVLTLTGTVADHDLASRDRLDHTVCLRHDDLARVTRRAHFHASADQRRLRAGAVALPGAAYCSPSGPSSRRRAPGTGSTHLRRSPSASAKRPQSRRAPGGSSRKRLPWRTEMRASPNVLSGFRWTFAWAIEKRSSSSARQERDLVRHEGHDIDELQVGDGCDSRRGLLVDLVALCRDRIAVRVLDVLTQRPPDQPGWRRWRPCAAPGRYGVSMKPKSLMRPYVARLPIRPMFGPSGVSIGQIRP